LVKEVLELSTKENGVTKKSQVLPRALPHIHILVKKMVNIVNGTDIENFKKEADLMR
jgi:hypothetical protein